MTAGDLIFLSPLIVLALSPVIIMLAVSFYRNYRFALFLSLAGIVIAFLSLFIIPDGPHHVTALLIIDGFALFYMGLILAASFVVALLSSDYLRTRRGNPEEFHVLLLLAVLGSAVLVASDHFASLFIGLPYRFHG